MACIFILSVFIINLLHKAFSKDKKIHVPNYKTVTNTDKANFLKSEKTKKEQYLAIERKKLTELNENTKKLRRYTEPFKQ